MTTLVCKNEFLFNVELCEKNIIYTLNKPENELQNSIQNVVHNHCKKINCIDINDVTIRYIHNVSVRQYPRMKVDSDCLFRCIVFLNDDTENCLIVTDIDENKYMYKRFSDFRSCIHIIRQKIGTHILIHPDKYIYSNKDELIDTLDIYVYYANKEIRFSEYDNNETIMPNNIYIENRLNYSYLNDVLYKHIYAHKFISDVIENTLYTGQAYRLLQGIDNNVKNKEIIQNQLVSMTNCIPNRFMNKLIYKTIFSESSCEWLIRFFDKSESRENILKINPNIFENFFTFTLFEYIMPFIVKSFDLDMSSFDIHVTDLFIVKDIPVKDISVKMANPTKGGFNISILLSKTKNEHLYYKFEDGVAYDIRQGDAIIYSLKNKRNQYMGDDAIYSLNVNFDILTKRAMSVL